MWSSTNRVGARRGDTRSGSDCQPEWSGSGRAVDSSGFSVAHCDECDANRPVDPPMGGPERGAQSKSISSVIRSTEKKKRPTGERRCRSIASTLRICNLRGPQDQPHSREIFRLHLTAHPHRPRRPRCIALVRPRPEPRGQASNHVKCCTPTTFRLVHWPRSADEPAAGNKRPRLPATCAAL